MELNGCEACGAPILAGEEICLGCRHDGALFALRWTVDLTAAGASLDEVDDVVGLTTAIEQEYARP